MNDVSFPVGRVLEAIQAAARRALPWFLVLAGCKPGASPLPASPEPQNPSVQEILAIMATRVAAASEQGASVVVGADGWLFSIPELRQMTAGPFWGEFAARVSRASQDQDPLPAILDFKAQLDRAGIALVFMPVPARATIYPELLLGPGEFPYEQTPARIDGANQEFLAKLQAAGIEVLDLVPDFLAHRHQPRGALYCKQDSHWSGVGIERAAEKLAARVRSEPWYGAVARRDLSHDVRELTFGGGLRHQLPEPRPEPEVLSLRYVGTPGPGGLEPVADWRESPVLLLGDSHNLIFHVGEDMHAIGAGLPDQLALELGFPVDVVAVRGHGATSARVNLARRRDRLQGKRLVIWCMSVLGYTEGQGWKKVPIIE